MVRVMTPLERIMSRITRTDDGCWLHPLNKGNRYAVVSVKGRQQKAHRVVYEATVGPIPAGMVIDHLCRQPACVRPEHLEAVSQRTNVLRGDGFYAANARKTHCPQGHHYEDGNVYVTKKGYRRCATCSKEQTARYRAKNC